MANRALAAKAARATTQRREAGHIEFTKPLFLIQSRVKAELIHVAMSCRDDVMVRRCEPARYVPATGKNKRCLSGAAAKFKIAAGMWSRPVSAE